MKNSVTPWGVDRTPRLSTNNKSSNGSTMYENDSACRCYPNKRRVTKRTKSKWSTDSKVLHILIKSTIIILSFLSYFDRVLADVGDLESVKFPTKCETCKFVATEILAKFAETAKTRDVLSTTGGVKKYEGSELRFLETMEGVCERILQYKMHKEHQNSFRFQKRTSKTMQALYGLKDKGVKVDLGLPEELWDSPSVEVTRMKGECEALVEKYEDDLETWFFDKSLQKRRSLMEFLCEDRVLKGKTDSIDCLYETEGDFKGVDEEMADLRKQEF